MATCWGEGEGGRGGKGRKESRAHGLDFGVAVARVRLRAEAGGKAALRIEEEAEVEAIEANILGFKVREKRRKSREGSDGCEKEDESGLESRRGQTTSRSNG